DELYRVRLDSPSIWQRRQSRNRDGIERDKLPAVESCMIPRRALLRCFLFHKLVWCLTDILNSNTTLVSQFCTGLSICCKNDFAAACYPPFGKTLQRELQPGQLLSYLADPPVICSIP